MDDKIKNTSKPGVAYYHLPGLFEFYGLYRMFLPLFYHHREYFYNWCAIGSIYGALGDCIWGGGRTSFGVQDPEDVMDLMREYGISARLTFSNSLLREEHLADIKCNALCKLFENSGGAQNGVIVHSDLLLRYLESRYPGLYFVSSTTKVLTEFTQLQAELNRDDFRYVVPDFRLNKEFEQLNNLPQREGTIRKALAYTLLDENNNAIESDLLEVTSESVLLDSVIVEQTMYAMKTLELSQTGLIQGTPKEGYEIKKISMTPENITVAGWSSEMAEIDALFTDATIDVSGLSDSVKQRVRLSNVPELKYVSATYVNVTIEIGPVLKSKSFTNLPIQIEGLEAGYNASMSRVNASVMITAPQNWLNALQSRDIRLVCDASGLAPGTYSLPVLCRIDADEDEEISVEVVPGNVSVTITVE